jgi:hypothetical protein
MKSRWFLAGLLCSVSGVALLGGDGGNFDHLTDADRKLMQERFNKEIWPLLERNGKEGCVGCHSTGKVLNTLKLTGKRELDFPKLLREGFFIPGDTGSLLARITSQNRRERMPPPGKGDPWSMDDIELLQRFVTDLDSKQQKK